MLLLLLLLVVLSDALPLEPVTLYSPNVGGWACYGSPVLLRTSDSLFAFAEARNNSCEPSESRAIVYRQSKDNGKTWGSIAVAAGPNGTAALTGPVVVQEKTSSRIFLLFTSNSKELMMSYSDNGGSSWSPAVVLPGMLGKDWLNLHSGPATGLQLSSGRLLIPGYHGISSKHEDETQSHVWISDDAGKSWSIGGTVGKLFFLDFDDASECQVTQNSLGSENVLLVARGRRKDRILANSKDGGSTWGKPFRAMAQPGGGVQMSIITVAVDANFTRMFTSAPMSNLGQDRTLMEVQSAVMPDGDWEMWNLIDQGNVGGSSLAFVPQKAMVAILYEQTKSKTSRDVTKIVFGYS